MKNIITHRCGWFDAYQEHVAGSGRKAIVGAEKSRPSAAGEFAAFGLRRIFSLRIAENLPEDRSGGELKLAPHLRRPRVPVSGVQCL